MKFKWFISKVNGVATMFIDNRYNQVICMSNDWDFEARGLSFKKACRRTRKLNKQVKA